MKTTAKIPKLSANDQLFKDLLQTFLGEFLTLVVPKVAKRLNLKKPQLLDKETFTDMPKGRHRYLDLLAKLDVLPSGPKTKAKPKQELALVHVEVEAKSGEEMPKRMWRYFMLLQLRHDLPVLPIVIFIKGGLPDLWWVTTTSTVFDNEISMFRFLSFGLSQASAEKYLKKPSVLAAALAAQMKPSRLSRAKLKVECLNKIGKAKLNEAEQFLLLNFVQTSLPLDGTDQQEYTSLLEQTPSKEANTMQLTWADQIHKKGEIQGRKEGRIEGHAEGRKEGERLTLREAIIEVLEGRGLQVTKAQRARLSTFSSAVTLRKALRNSITAASFDDLFPPKPARTTKK